MPVPTPRVLLLDVMDTLVHDPFHLEIPRFFDTSLPELVPRLREGAWVSFEQGELPEPEFFARFFADGHPVDGEALRAAVRAGYRLLPGVEPLLAELHERGVPMHTLSNYPCWYEMIEDAVGLSRWVEWTFVSCRTGLRKPDPEAYRHAYRTLGVEPSACMFVDDRETNCAAARAEGMQAVRFTDAAALREVLVDRGVL